MERRGILFAPVYFEPGLYSRRGYFYSPTIVIDLGVFSDHLFLRPRYHHYYFGDYYAASYVRGGFYASFSFQSGRYGYDPIYSHQRWEHRQDREWDHRVTASYEYRRDHEAARPPRTWAAQRNINPGTAESKQNRVLVAMSIDQLAKRKNSSMRFQPVAKEERQKLAARGQEVQQSRDRRQTLEAKAVGTTVRKPGAAFEPAKVTLPRSPIVAKPANQLGRNQAPPKAQQSPKPDPKFQPKSDTSGRQPDVNRSNPQSQPRTLEPEKKSTPGRSEGAPREKQVQPEPQPRAKEATTQAQEESQRNASGSEKKAQPESERRAKDAAVKGREDSQWNASVLEKRPQRVTEPPGKRRPDALERGATKLLKNDRQKAGNGKPSARENQPFPRPASP